MNKEGEGQQFTLPKQGEILGLVEGTLPESLLEVEVTRAKEIADLSDAKLVGALLDQLDTALDTYDATVDGHPSIESDEKAALLEIIQDLRNGVDVPEVFLKEAGIKITHKVRKPQDEARMDRGEDIGVNVEVNLPKQGKVIVLNIYGSRLDYESSSHFMGGNVGRSELVIDRPRTINFHVYKKSVGTHGRVLSDRLLHDARYVFFRSGHPGNRLEVMRYDGDRISPDDRPVNITDPRISQRMNGDLYKLTDEFFTRRGVEEAEG